MMHKKETNTRATDNQRYEEEDDFVTMNSSDLLINGKQRANNGLKRKNDQHGRLGDEQNDSDDENYCLDSVLSRVSASMGLKPIPSSESSSLLHNDNSRQEWRHSYKPVSVRLSHHPPPQEPQAHGPNGGSFPRPSNELNRQHSMPPPSNFGVVRRRPCNRRCSEGPMNLRAPITKKAEDRSSFELKQNALYSMQTDGTLEQLSALENLRAEESFQNAQNFWRRLAFRASSPDTSQKELIQRSTFLLLSVLTVGAGILWALMYVALKEWTAALMPVIYSTSMSFILFTCICSANRGEGDKAYNTFVECQLALILILPFAVHVALGGVEESGGVMLWSFLCPMGAAFFRSAKESVRWFSLYTGICLTLLIREFSTVRANLSLPELDEDAGSNDLPSSSESVERMYYLMNIVGVFCVIFAAVFLFARELEKEYTKSEEVLLNILPASIVKRVKRGEFPIVDHVAGVTILFADLVGFTKASTELHPNFLIGLFLRDIFQAYDELVYKHGLEKIKTIGDAYMVVGGLNHGEIRTSCTAVQHGAPPPHAINTMLLAVDMFEALEKVNKKYNLKFDVRMGVHTGSVVAGVLGLKRFTYDVWGDSVNVSVMQLFVLSCSFIPDPHESMYVCFLLGIFFTDSKPNGIKWRPRPHSFIRRHARSRRRND